MIELLVQKALRSGQSLDSLLEEHQLKTDMKDGLVLLNYDFKAMKSHPLVQECRSLILEERTWDVISMAFPRFFNSGEGTAAEIDWATAYAEDKIDGSLLQLFYYKGKWRCATRGKLDAAGGLGDSSVHETFADLFWSVLAKYTTDFDKDLSTIHNYVFELVSPWNRIVTVYEEPALYLLTARSIKRMDEVHPELLDAVAKRVGFHRPKRYKLSSLDEVKGFTETIGVTEEGFVVRDGNDNRIKVKNLSYMSLFNMFNGGEPDFWSILLSENESEFLSYFPEFSKHVETRRKWLSGFIEDLNKTWEANKDTEDQKTFAMAVKDLPGSALLFSTRKKQLKSVMDLWLEMDQEAKLKTCERQYPSDAQ